MIQYILTDIEGTTTPVDFVHKVLFPYSSQHLSQFMAQHAQEQSVRSAINQCQETMREERGISNPSLEAVTNQMLDWITADRKHPALKSIQGMIWRHGYEAGEFTSQIYPDVPPALQKWQEQGLKMGVYSSGSVEAQKLLFRFTEYGDLTKYFSNYFDTAVGAKREKKSYLDISNRLGIAPGQILFLSDIVQELDAAHEIGLACVHIVRPGTEPGKTHRVASNFSELEGHTV